MATITLKSKTYDGRYMQLECTSASNGSVKNSSTVTWTLTTAGGSAVNYSTGATKVVINGSTVYSKDRVSYSTGKFPAAKGSVSGSLVVPHNNDGTKSINVKFSTAIYTSTISEYSGTLKLDAIPRYGTVSHSLKSKTETTVVMNWSSDSTVDYLWYSKDNGTNWAGIDVADSKSGTYTITGLKANTTYKVKTRIRRKDSQLTTDSGALSVTTYDYPHCISAPDFVLGDPVTFKFYNPLNRTFDFSIVANNKDLYTFTNQSGTSYTGANSADVVSALYNSIPNELFIRYGIGVKYGGLELIKFDGYYEVNTDKCMPSFSTFTYYDNNASVTNVTGNTQAIVKGLSHLNVVIAPANNMVAKNGATPDSYSFDIDALSATANYSTGGASAALGAVPSAGVKRLTVHARDSRGLFATAYKDITVIDYAKPVVNVSAKRKNNFENETTLSVSGEYAPIEVGGADKNNVSGVEYRYRESGGEWTAYKPLAVTSSGGAFTCTDVTLDLDNAEAFEFEITATDKFTTSTAPANVDVGIPIFMISSNKKMCYINGDEIATVKSVQDVSNAVPTAAEIIDCVYPVGSVYVTNTNTSPADLLERGSWTLIDKEFTPKHYTVTTAPEYFTPAADWYGVNLHYIAGGHSLRIRQAVQCDLALSDSGSLVGYFNWENFGVADIGDGIIEYTTYSDTANSGFVYNIAYDTGECKVVDVFDLSTVPSDAPFYLDFVLVFDSSRMLDEYCNKFYWKRTS